MTVYNGKVVVVIFLADKTAGVLAEGAYLVFKRLGIADVLGLIQHLVDTLHNLVAYLNTHSDVNRTRLMCYVVLGTHVFKPACTASARCDYGMLCADFTVFAVFLDICATASLALYYYIGTLPAEHYLNAVFLKVFFNCKIKLLCLFGAEVAYRAVNKAKSCLNGFQSDVFYLFGVSDSLDLIIGAELKIYLICVVYHLGGIFVAYKLGEHSADIGRERQLSVRECACA